jgi:uncharacterized protein YndB with AHSA1/START domain
MSESQTGTTQELVIERVIDAPREQVWEAWTDPEKVKQWWGPKQFTAPTIQSDFKVGGTYLYSMRSPEGQEFWSTGTFREIVPMERIVVTDSFADEDGNAVPASHYGMGEGFPDETEITVTFEDVNGKTRLTVRQPAIPGEMGEQSEQGWNESLDKFEESVKTS